MLLIVYGEDAFRVKERARELVSKFQEKHDPTRLNIDEIVFSTKSELSRERVAETIMAMPFLSTKRMVRIDGLLSFITTKPDARPWIELFAHIPESSVVLLVDSVSKEKSEKTELFKKLATEKDVHCYELPLLQGPELRSWIQQRAQSHGGVIVPAVAGALVERIGPDSWGIENAIRTLVAYAGEAPVDIEMMRTVISPEHNEDLFGMIDALSSGRSVFALQRLAEERSAGVDEFPLFGMIARQVRLLLQVKALQDDMPGLGKQNIADAFGIHPFVAQKVLAEAKRHDFSRIRAWHSLVSELDIAMKRGLSPDVAVDRLVAELLDAS